MKKTITVLTATRAEYGLLKTIIKEMKADKRLDVKVVVTGAHLSPEFGLTYKEIENDGIEIDKKIDILLSSDTPSAISKSMGLAMIGFGDYFEQEHTDALMVLGDRYETLAVCCAAMNKNIPILHLYGGETTQGAIDEAIRHSITKMSYFHFTSTEEYRNRVIQLGEEPDRVFNVGAIGVENALKVPLLSLKELEISLNFELGDRYIVFTYHPVTLENNSEKEFEKILKTLDKFEDIKVLFTKANADASGRLINKMIEKYCEKRSNCILVDSLGMVRYLSAVKYSLFVMGNSSSGIIEVPAFKVPTINIGDRQKGRLQPESVINCELNIDSMTEAVNLALSREFADKIKNMVNPFGDGTTTEKIIEVLDKRFINSKISLKKKFYDVDIK